MIRITDMTFSCIDHSNCDDAMLRILYEMLSICGVDFVEMPEAVYRRLKPVSAAPIVLRIDMPCKAACYPEIQRFICRQNGFAVTPGIIITQEIQMNDIREISFLNRDAPKCIRIVGLDDVFTHDYKAAFSKLQNRTGSRVELCPENGCYCATAIAVEWMTNGGTDIAAAFGGLGGKAALEEVLLALRVVRRHKPGASFAVLPQLAGLIEEITGVRFPDRKAIIGRSIFNVESGIHVDGILKKPQMYEPFQPQLVGGCRRIVIGKHSGRKSVAAKLNELGAVSDDFDIARILGAVRKESINKKASLTDEEFMIIASKYKIQCSRRRHETCQAHCGYDNAGRGADPGHCHVTGAEASDCSISRCGRYTSD